MPFPSLRRRALLAAPVLPLLGAVPRAARAEAWPDRPVRIVVPFAPGGATDIVGRLIGAELSKAFGQPFVVENRPGGGGNIGSDLVAKAAPDGYTLLLGAAGNIAINPGLFPNMPYDPVKDLAPISLICETMNVLVVHPGVPARSVQELIALAKAQPGALSFASSGNGGTTHLAGEMFKAMTGTDMVHVPYRGSAPAMTDLLSGTVQLMFDNLPSALPHVREGRLRALAVTGATRSPAMPDLPTMAEAGVAGYEATSWFGLFAPAGTPAALVDRLADAVAAAVRHDDVQARIRALGAEPITNRPAAFAAMVRAEVAKWRGVIEASGALAD